ncbi:MAG: bifunctional DNA-formamidopyrimidine glycosylase/DNA-(apurinic or apyrimidinic site) lyase, partial [Steroidobacteraceae bacterium]
MPELPEVETTRRGLAPHALGRRIIALKMYQRRLRWPVAAGLPARLAGQRIVDTSRRAKYLLLTLESGTLLMHLGMSGSLRVIPAQTPRVLHDHFDLVLDSGLALRFNDPRRFGSLIYTRGDPLGHPLLAKLAPEPFDAAFDAQYLWRITRRRRLSVKQLLMNSRLVVGVGNIYASEALFRARVRPRRQARSLTQAEA